MRLAGRSRPFTSALVAGGVAATGCGDDTGGLVMPTDSAAEGSPAEGAAADAMPDGRSVDAPLVGAGPAEAGSFDAGSDEGVDATLLGAVDSAAQSSGTTLVITIDDASLQTVISGACAAVSSFIAAPVETGVGHTISLIATGVDPTNQSADVDLTWTTTGAAGSLTVKSGPSTSFQCASAGVEAVSVTATISDGGASCPNIGSVTATLKCDPP